MYFITNAEEFPIYADSLVEAAKARGVTKWAPQNTQVLYWAQAHAAAVRRTSRA